LNPGYNLIKKSMTDKW